MAKDTAKAARKPATKAKSAASPGSKTPRKTFDWDAIEKEYRAGQLSNREIAAKYGPTETAIRKRAKRDGWTRDLRDQVRKATADKLVRAEVRKPDTQDDDRVVDQVSDRAVEIVLSHRKDIREGREMTSLLFEELRDGTANRVLLHELVDQIAESEEWNERARSAAMRAISLPQRAGVLRDLANSMKVLQGLERTAYNIDDKDKPKDPLDELLDAVMDRSRGVDGYGG